MVALHIISKMNNYAKLTKLNLINKTDIYRDSKSMIIISYMIPTSFGHLIYQPNVSCTLGIKIMAFSVAYSN